MCTFGAHLKNFNSLSMWGLDISAFKQLYYPKRMVIFLFLVLKEIYFRDMIAKSWDFDIFIRLSNENILLTIP